MSGSSLVPAGEPRAAAPSSAPRAAGRLRAEIRAQLLQSASSCFVCRLWLQRFSLSLRMAQEDARGRSPGALPAGLCVQGCSSPGAFCPSPPPAHRLLTASKTENVENSHLCCWTLVIPLEGLEAKVVAGVRRRLHSTGPVAAGTGWHGECGIPAVHPRGPCQLPAHRMSGGSSSRSPALAFQAPGAVRGAGQSRDAVRQTVPLLLPTSDSFSFPLLYGHDRLPGGFPKASPALLSSGLRE